MMYLTVGVIWSTVRGTRGKVACLSKSSVKKEEKLPVIAVTTIADDQLLSRTGKRNGLHGEIEAHLIPDGPKKSANAVKSADVYGEAEKPTSSDTNGGSLGGAVSETTCVVLRSGGSEVDNDSSLLIGSPERCVLVGAVGVIEWLVNSIGNMGIYNECTDDVDIHHLSSAHVTPKDETTYLPEVGDRLGSIIRPVPLQSDTSAVNTSFQVPELFHDLLDGSFDSLVIGDVDSDVKRFPVR